MSAPSSTGLDSRLASVLCYSVWWITGGLFLLLERRQPDVRFHAAQSLVLFGVISALLIGVGAISAVALMMSSEAYQLIRICGDLLWIGAAALWFVLIVRAWRGEMWRVPLAAALADHVVARTSS